MNLMEKLWRPRALNAMTDVVQPAPVTKARFKDGLRYALVVARDLLLPPVCPVCREPVAGAGGLCAHCWAKLSFIARPYCERLGTPFTHDMGAGVLSVRAIADPPAYGRARAAVRYDEIARALVHALKYGDRLELAPTMGRWMAQAGNELLTDADAIVPCRCIGVAFGPGDSIRRRYSPRRSPGRADGPSGMLHCGASARRRNKSDFPRPSAREMCRPHSASRQGDNPRQAYRAG